MSASRARRFAAASLLALPAAGALIPAAFLVDPASAEGHRREAGQEHFGRRCTYEDTQVAAGTIVGAGGQVIAGGGGTGAGCDTFYAYEVRTGAPNAAVPWTEPGVYLNPGAAVRR